MEIVLVMTDGKQTVEKDGVLSSDILRDAVQPLKDKGIRVISLGVGKGIGLFDLVTLASTDLDVYTATDFEELETLVTELTKGNCPVHGNWSDWGEWSNCTVSCGGGEQTRYRDCDNPPPAYGGRECLGVSEETRPCNELPCAVDGGWTEWKPWEICPVTCGGGIQNRYRTCTDPPPAHGGKDCSGEGVLTRPCNEEPCPVHGNWARWEDWRQCSVSCGGGTQIRSRTCTNPPPQFGGRNCSGESQNERSCNEQRCPIHGNWARWEDWRQCSVSCGGGTQIRSRTCTNPPPQFGGRNCSGESQNERSCNEQRCPIDGNWNGWGDWEVCSVTCGGGIQSRTRTCTNPWPRFEGRDCNGEEFEERPCNDNPCPIDGRWTRWGDWEQCSMTCGGGVQVSRRSCTDPAPAFEGANCEGDSLRSRSCNEEECPVDGRWTKWGAWEPCPVSCGGGIQLSKRSCTNPAPAFGGDDCEGDSVRSRSCNERGCPADGNWSVWSEFTLCSVFCGGGRQNRSRTCTNPPPKNDGKYCAGESSEIRPCNTLPCPVDGGWSSFGEWGSCSLTCGGGVQDRQRTCTNPPPAHSGRPCDGSSVETRFCKQFPCPVHGNWARWQSWSICSKSCGGGDQSRMRTCTNPPPLHGGRQCLGRNKETRSCNRRPCPVDGNWADWKPWSSCSRSCAGGKQIRWRSCTNPQPSSGGSWCIGSRQETKSCNEDKLCPVNGGWSFWGYWGRCSVSCGAGVRHRARTCNNPPPAHGGARCRGESKEVSYCESSSCPVDGNWSQWGRFSRCSKRCWGGIKRRYRFCSNPRPSNGGKECPGEGVEEIPCNTRPCSVNGNWGRWDNWSPCSVTCGGLGLRIRRRQCNNPPPSHGGRYCPGSSSFTASCAGWLPCEVNCNIPLDFAIIVDTSGSISRRNFHLLQRFIHSLVDGFKVAKDYTHIAIIEYSTAASVQLRFNDLSGRNLTRNNVNKKVQSMPHKKGFTFIDKALRKADQDVFTYAAGMRYDSDKVALVMTDGEQTVEKNSTKSDIEILTEASKPLKDKGVRIISLGIGRRANKKSLEAISSGSDVYSSESFSKLRLLVRKLKKGTCQATVTAAGYKYVRRTKKI
ncbi:Hemicentin-1 [Stylophora pistillata]|uniref:Hemicentin-1 n=1 Tax=Stylophora pistillata TaxID=50429 RepID=A0A2B4SV42_STYPI|nr:Hemicentin-1 [Stylophora pistillata]